MSAKKRVQLHDKIRKEEREWITQFTLTHVVPCEGSAVPTKEVFDQYCDYLARIDKGPSQLTIDGFGRMFPKSFERKYVNFKDGGKNAILNIKVIR